MKLSPSLQVSVNMAKPYVREEGVCRLLAVVFFIRNAAQCCRLWGADSTVAKWDFATGEPPALSRLHSNVTQQREMLAMHQSSHHKNTHKHTSLISVTHRLKCSMIFSSRTFSGKFPTHKCLVSRTILWAPAPLSYRWVCYVSSLPCKKENVCKINAAQEKKISGANHWLVVVNQCKPLGWIPARCLILTAPTLLKRDLAPRERAPDCSRD